MDVRRENTNVRWVGLRPLVETSPSNFRFFPYGHLFSAASWYYAKGINTDVNTHVRGC
jgi:hypothetical protein